MPYMTAAMKKALTHRPTVANTYGRENRPFTPTVGAGGGTRMSSGRQSRGTMPAERSIEATMAIASSLRFLTTSHRADSGRTKWIATA